MDFTSEITAFTSIFKFQTIKISGGTFRYLLGGEENKQSIVLLNGGTNCSEMWFKYFLDLSKNYKVLIFDYSQDFKTNNSQVIAMNELFTKLGLSTPFLIGASFGGFIAEIYTSKFPSQVGGLILLSTAALTDYTKKSLKLKKLLAPLLLLYMKHCNYDKLKASVIKGSMKYVKNESDEIKKYTFDMFSYIFKDYTREKDIHVTSLLADIFNTNSVTKDTFSHLKDKILLMLPKDDYFSPAVQEDLIKTMNEPKIKYVNGGHIATVLYVEEYLKEIRSFLEDLEEK